MPLKVEMAATYYMKQGPELLDDNPILFVNRAPENKPLNFDTLRYESQ